MLYNKAWLEAMEIENMTGRDVTLDQKQTFVFQGSFSVPANGTRRLRLVARVAKRRSLMVLVGGISGNLSKEMSEKIDSPYGRIVYHQRIAIVEPAFANIRYSKGMDRFTLRGKIKVNIQWLLYCMVHNIGKIANYGFT